jgi:Cdc6-like AAA superfamily ATPase
MSRATTIATPPDDQAEPILSEDRRQELTIAVSRAFCPATPVTHRQLFSGRVEQIADLIDSVNTPGQHAIIYGERGVGKTSLANYMAFSLSSVLTTVHITCDGSDTFDSIWRKVTDDIEMVIATPGVGFVTSVRTKRAAASEFLPIDEELTPEHVRRALGLLSMDRPIVVFIDEFDRLQDQESLALFADTVKLLSDRAVPATLVLVGVADRVGELIGEHSSVSRALIQVKMPRMSADELREIIGRGTARVGMKASRTATNAIVELSQGLPHYTHLLGLWSARAAISAGRLNMTPQDVRVAIHRAIARTEETIALSYDRATSSSRPDSMFQEVLLACALARADERGFFPAAAVRKPLQAITGKPYDYPSYARHLAAFSEKERGRILERAGTPRRYRFRFVNPLLTPYVLMKGIQEQLVDPAVLAELV